MLKIVLDVSNIKCYIHNIGFNIKRNGFNVVNMKSIIANMKLDIKRNGFNIVNMKSVIANMKQVWRQKWHNFRFVRQIF